MYAQIKILANGLHLVDCALAKMFSFGLLQLHQQ